MKYVLRYANKENIYENVRYIECNVLSENESSELYDACLHINNLIKIKCNDLYIRDTLRKFNDICQNYKDTSLRSCIEINSLVQQYFSAHRVLVNSWEKLSNDYDIVNQYNKELNDFRKTQYYSIVRILRNTSTHYSNDVDSIRHDKTGIRIFIARQKILDNLNRNPKKYSSDINTILKFDEYIDVNKIIEKSFCDLINFHGTLIKCLLDANMICLEKIMKFYFKIVPEKYYANSWIITKGTSDCSSCSVVDVRWNDYKSILKNAYNVDVEAIGHKYGCC